MHIKKENKVFNCNGEVNDKKNNKLLSDLYHIFQHKSKNRLSEKSFKWENQKYRY